MDMRRDETLAQIKKAFGVEALCGCGLARRLMRPGCAQPCPVTPLRLVNRP